MQLMFGIALRDWQSIARRIARAGAMALLSIALIPLATAADDPPTPAVAIAKTRFTVREAMVPMRDGVRLQTIVFTPVGRGDRLPILLRRTPYGIPDASWTPGYGLADLEKDGYIYVVQNIRGRFKSEGTFRLADSMRLDGGTTVQSRDAYDTIDWLVRNVPGSNGRVGIYGVSYDGLTAAAALIGAHPALKAVSEQAAPVDQWLNDDFHRYGALRLSYAFEYSVMEEGNRHDNTRFEFDRWDTFDWYLNAGELATLDLRRFGARLPFWQGLVDHPDYDAFWANQAWLPAIRGARVPVLNVAGFWDQEDPWGPWEIFRALRADDPEGVHVMAAGPWNHGGWRRVADRLGPVALGQDTARAFLRDVEAPFFAYWLHGRGSKPAGGVVTFQTGSNSWRRYAAWPPRRETTALFLHPDGRLDFTAPDPRATVSSVSFLSDPAKPVPYRRRPISPTYPGLDWRYWEAEDQRFVDGRPDVLTFTSAPLERDLAVTGEVSAELFAATSGTDSDFVVKLIDVFPEDAETPEWPGGTAPIGAHTTVSNGYQLPIAMEVRRGRYLQQRTARALVPNQATRWDVPLRARDHVFRKGHRIMVQIQSSWFPLIDRNPQQFVRDIARARAADYRVARQTIFTSVKYPSRILLPSAR